MSVTTSTKCHILPHSLVVLQVPPPSISISHPYSHPNSPLAESPKATRTHPARRSISRSFSLSVITSSSSSSRPPMVHTSSGNTLSGNVLLYGQGFGPSAFELESPISDPSIRMQYLYDGPTDVDVIGHAVTPLTPANSPQRTRQRARSTRQRMQEMAATSGLRSTAKGSRAVEISSERLKRSESGGDISGYNAGPRHENNKHANLREAEAAVQKELDEDDYAWYYRNPQRYVWRPGNTRKRMQRRKRVIYGVATGEEGAPTNMSLFITYLLQQQYSPTLLLPLLGPEAHKEPITITERYPPSANGIYDVRYEEASLFSLPDMQEDLFSPNEYRSPRGPERKSMSCSSSMDSSDSSFLSISSAASSPQLGYTFNNDKSNNDIMLNFTRSKKL